MKFQTIVQLLGLWGYLDNGGVISLVWGIWKEHGPEFKEALRRFKERWGAKFNLSNDVHLDAATIQLMARRFCHLPDDVLAVGEGLRRWNGNAISWRDAGVRVGQLDFSAAMDFTKAQIEQACNLQINKVTSGGNVVSSSGRIDGPGSILAYAYLPGFPSSLGDTLTQTYDVAETALSQHEFNLVACHESGHSCGLDHDTGPEICLMDPYLNSSLTGLQPGDVRQFQARYGPPKNATPDLTTIILKISGRDLSIVEQ